MKKTILILGVTTLGMLFSCGKKEEKTASNPLLFSTTIDNLQGWAKDKSFQKEHSVSGIWGVAVNKQNPFSFGLEIPFQSIPSNNIKKVRFSAFIKTKGNNNNTDVCLDVRNPQDSCLNWQSSKINVLIKEGDDFMKFEKTFDIANINKENSKIKMFIWNSGADSTSQLYMDDIEIEFLEK